MTSGDVESTTIESAADAFSALGDPIRLRVLAALGHGQRCVCELLETIEVAPNLLSYHLRVLREAGLIVGERRGRWVDYRLAGERLDLLRSEIPSGSGS
jgi:ArsR family transcriptional regulator